MQSGSCAVSGGGLCTYIGHNYVQMGMSPLRHTSHVTSHVINYARRINTNHHAEHPSTAHNEHSTSQHSKRGMATSSAPANERTRHSTTSLTATQWLNDERQVIRRFRCRWVINANCPSPSLCNSHQNLVPRRHRAMWQPNNERRHWSLFIVVYCIWQPHATTTRDDKTTSIRDDNKPTTTTRKEGTTMSTHPTTPSPSLSPHHSIPPPSSLFLHCPPLPPFSLTALHHSPPHSPSTTHTHTLHYSLPTTPFPLTLNVLE